MCVTESADSVCTVTENDRCMNGGSGSILH